jgi:hypothetical protein
LLENIRYQTCCHAIQQHHYKFTHDLEALINTWNSAPEQRMEKMMGRLSNQVNATTQKNGLLGVLFLPMLLPSKQENPNPKAKAQKPTLPSNTPRKRSKQMETITKIQSKQIKKRKPCLVPNNQEKIKINCCTP